MDNKVTEKDIDVVSSEQEQFGLGTDEPLQQLQAQAQLECLQAMNEKLRRENYYLKKLLSLQFDSDLKAQKTGIRLANAAGDQPGAISSYQDECGYYKGFPETVLKKVFGNITDQETLLNCRLVCRQWNYTIITTAEFMGQIDFPIWHPKLFLDLQIANQVKSIVFKLSFPADSDHWMEFLDVISKTVRKEGETCPWSVQNVDKSYDSGLP